MPGQSLQGRGVGRCAPTDAKTWAWRALDALLLTLLAVYAYAGVPGVPFHGDEGMQVYATRDYLTAFVERTPADLLTNPPYTIDSRPHLRLINGSVQRYAAGFVLYTVRGHNEGDLPLPPGWNWGLDYADNVAGGWLPKTSVLHPARYVSTTFFVLSIGVVFALGRVLGGRAVAYPAAVLYGLNAGLLLNVRRAVMEGSSLLFGLLAVLVAALLARQIAHGRFPRLWWWAALVLAGGLALASKHSSAIYLVGAWLWVFAAAVITGAAARRVRPMLQVTGALAVTGTAAIALFIALSPALWNDPPARLGNLIEERGKIVAVQISIDENAPMPLQQRVGALFTEPFGAAPMYYEFSYYADAAPIAEQITGYERAGVAGLPTHAVIGVPLTALLLLGIGVAARRARASTADAAQLTGLLLWYGVTAGALLFNPLPWQRYYLPLIAVAVLLAGVGARAVLLWICQQFPTQNRQSAVAAESVVRQTK